MPIVTNKFGAFKDADAAGRKACLAAMGAACLEVAMPNAPVLTGNLRRSHTMSIKSDDVLVGVTAEYGGYVHNGTSRQKAQPWLRDAVDRNKQAIAKMGVAGYSGAVGGA